MRSRSRTRPAGGAAVLADQLMRVGYAHMHLRRVWWPSISITVGVHQRMRVGPCNYAVQHGLRSVRQLVRVDRCLSFLERKKTRFQLYEIFTGLIIISILCEALLPVGVERVWEEEVGGNV